MTEVGGIVGAYKYKDREYLLAPLSIEDYCAFGATLQRDAYEAVKRNARFISRNEDEFREFLNLVTRDIAAKKYNFGGEVYKQAACSLDGIKFFVLRSMRKHDPSVDEILVDEIFSVDMPGILEAAKNVK